MIDLLATQPHYRDHLQPVWDALPDALRGGLGARRGTAVIVAAGQDLVRARALGYTRIAYLEHGIGQSYATGHPAYPGGRGRDAVGLFLSPNETAAGMDRAAYPRARVEVIGCPKLDTLPRQVGSRRVVCISFHWSSNLAPETISAMPYYRPVLAELARSFEVIGHAHHRKAGMMRREYDKLGIEWVPDFRQVCERAAVYVCDNSSTIYEFASTGRPVVLLNAPWFRRDVELGLRFWAAADVGRQVDDPTQLVSTVGAALTSGDHESEREAALELVYASRSGAAKRAAAAIVDWLGAREAIAA